MQLRDIDLTDSDILVSFDDVSLFTNILADEALKVISKKLHNDHALSKCSAFPVKAIMKLGSLRTTYFQMDKSFYQQKEGMVMVNSLSPVVNNILHRGFWKATSRHSQSISQYGGFAMWMILLLPGHMV
jgi:hypothetical protein